MGGEQRAEAVSDHEEDGLQKPGLLWLVGKKPAQTGTIVGEGMESVFNGVIVRLSAFSFLQVIIQRMDKHY